MTPLTKVGKRLDNITRYILDINPQDKWILSNIVPMFLEAIKSSITIQEEQLITSQLNKLLDNFEFRYNQIFEEKNKIARQINQNLQELVTNTEIICDNCGWRWKIKDGGDDLYICHKCNHDNTPNELKEEKAKRDRCLKIADRKFDKPSAYKSGAVVRCRKGDIWKDIKEIIQEVIQEDESLHKWFKRKGPKGKEGGWVDCNAPDGDGGYKACGRKEGEKRSKYPSCRPTAAQCKTPGKGTKWGKTK